MRDYGIGLVGWGTVGAGVVDIITREGEMLATRTGIRPVLRRIVTRTPSRQRSLVPAGVPVGSDMQAIVGDPTIDTVVHLVGGTTDATAIAKACLSVGKHVVTANKAMLAEHGEDLFKLAGSKGACIAFEAAVAGGIPVIAALRDGLIANRVQAIHGILNGTCNYILTRMEEDKISYADALKAAQAKGYAEADPTLDVDGTDTAHKLALLARIAYSGLIKMDTIEKQGIQNLTARDINSAAQMDCRIKLLGVAEFTDGALSLRVEPTLVPYGHPLAEVRKNYNAIEIVGHAAGPIFLQGQGAGSLPTASAVVADIMDLALGRYQQTAAQFTFFAPGKPLKVSRAKLMACPWFARFEVRDVAGVLATITKQLAAKQVSIASLHQAGPDDDTEAEIEVITHECPGTAFQAAVQAIDATGITIRPTVVLRRL